MKRKSYLFVNSNIYDNVSIIVQLFIDSIFKINQDFLGNERCCADIIIVYHFFFFLNQFISSLLYINNAKMVLCIIDIILSLIIHYL